VILITTKQGEKGKVKLTYNSYGRVGQAANLVDVLSPTEYVDYQNDAREALGFLPRFYTFADGTITEFIDSPEFIEANADSLGRLQPVNWFEDVFEPSFSQSHRLSASGGTEKGKFFLAGGYMTNQGLVPNAKVRTGDILAKYDHKFSDRLKVSTRASLSSIRNQASKGTENLGGANNSIIRQITLSAPLLGYSENNLVEGVEESLDGPRAWLSDYDDDSREFRSLFSVSGDYQISDVFTYRLQIGGDYRKKERNVWYGLGLQRGLQSNGEAGESILTRLRYNVDNTLMFKKKIGRGQKISGTVGVVYDVTNLDQETFTANDFPNPELRYDGLDQGRAFSPRLFDSRDEQLLSFLGRINYSYKSRYLLTASFRSDGSSKFAPGNKYSFFPALAAAWRISNEDFLKDQNLISDAKIRIGYGLTGSQAIRPYQTLARYGPTAALQSDANGNPIDAQRPLNLANPNLRWETTRQLNAGFDFGILNDRITATVDVYHKQTSDLLQQLNVGPSAGFSTITTNQGDLVNRGVEFAVSAAILNGKFKWNVSANIARNRNEIKNLGLPEAQFGQERYSAFVGRQVSGGTFFKAPANIFIEGQPAGLFYGFATNGIVADAADLEIAPNVQGFETVLGDVFYVDQNGDGNITEADLTIIGDPNPDFNYGIGMNFAYGQFSLNFLVNGVEGNEIANGNLSRSGFARGLSDNIRRETYLNAWTPENPEGTFPRLNYQNPGDFVDRFIEDGSFLRLSYVSLGYSLPAETIKGITNAQLFFSGQNLFVLTKYSGFDPEVDSFFSDPLRRGIDWSSFPKLRSYTIGLTVGF
jgi:TonB-linked SusC/RagA family outer membrane protein